MNKWVYRILGTLAAIALFSLGFYLYDFKFLSAVLGIALSVSLFYLYRFMRIILIFEEDIATTLQTFKECEESLENVISLRLFFDSEHVRPVVDAARQEVMMCRVKVRQMAQRFVERSKQQYVIYEEPVEVEQVRGQPGAINDELITSRILGFKQELGEDADVYFMTTDEMTAARKARNI